MENDKILLSFYLPSHRETLRVSRLTVFRPLVSKLAPRPMSRLGFGFHSHLFTPARFACSRTHRVRFTQMSPHFCTLGLNSPPDSPRRAEYDSCGQGHCSHGPDCRTSACEQPLVACRTYFVLVWRSPTDPRIRFPGEMGSRACE